MQRENNINLIYIKMRIKQISVFLLIMLCFCTAMNAANRQPVIKNPLKKAPTAIVDGINYRLDEKNQKAKVISGENLYTGDIVIPEKIEYDSVKYYVEEIDDNAFKDCASLSSITIPTTITKIGSGVFKNCTALEEITIPESVKEIKSETFEGCSNLMMIRMHNGITELNQGAFKKCTALESIALPNNLSTLPNNLFQGCSNLKNVRLPGSLSKIGSSVFEECASLEEVDIPNGVKSIGSDAFKNSTMLHRFSSTTMASLRDAPI